MKPQCLLVGSVGGLKAAAITVGTYFALQRLGVEVVGMAGASGGSIPLALLSRGLSKQEVCRLICEINSKKLQDKDIVQQAWDAFRKHIPFLGKRKGDKGFTGVLRGNGLYYAFKELYQKAGCETFAQSKIPFAIVSAKIANSKNVEIEGPASLALAQTLEAEVWFHERSLYKNVLIADAVRCSTAIPGAFRPWYVENVGTFIDGGAVNAIPALTAVRLFGANNLVMADATSDIFEANYESDDINDILDVAIASVYAIVRDATLQRVRQATELVRESGYTAVKVTPVVKLKMFDTKGFAKAVEVAEAQAFEELKGIVSSFR